MAGSDVQTLLRKPLPFLFDPKHKIYPIVMVVTICLLVICASLTTICVKKPQRGMSSSTLTNTNKQTDFLVEVSNCVGGLSQSVLSIGWIIYHRGLIACIRNKIYKLQKSVCCEKELTWFSKEMRICYLLMAVTTVSQGWTEIKTLYHLYRYTTFLINISFAFAICGQLSILLHYLGSFYDHLLDLKNYEISVKWYQFLSSIYDDVWKFYKLPVLLITTWGLVLTFAHLYLLLYPAFPGNFFMNILYTMWIYLFFFPTLSTIRSCNYVIRKDKQFNEEIYWNMANDKSYELLNKELLAFHFIGSEGPKFTACGLFSLDNSLIFSAISQITTYLVIVLQVAKCSGVTSESAINAKPCA